MALSQEKKDHLTKLTEWIFRNSDEVGVIDPVLEARLSNDQAAMATEIGVPLEIIKSNADSFFSDPDLEEILDLMISVTFKEFLRANPGIDFDKVLDA